MNDNVRTQSRYTVRPVAGRIGAEISGLLLTGDLPEGTITAIRQTLHEHKVLFFRDQWHLDDAHRKRSDAASARPSRTRRSRRATAPP